MNQAVNQNYTNIDPKYYLGCLYEREHQGQIGVRSGSDDNGDNHYDDDYDDDAYTDTKAVSMTLLAIMIAFE